MENAGKFRKNKEEEDGKLWKIARIFHGRKGNFWKVLGRFGFIIIVTRKEFGTSINRRAIPPKVDRFHHLEYRFQLAKSHP